MQKNRNNPAHGKKYGKTEFQIESLLPVGKENAVTTAELVKRSRCSSARALQQKIAYERNHGAVICSGSGKGYWKPKNRQEIVEFCRTMDARARNTFAATRSAKRVLKMPEGQQDMSGGQEDVRQQEILLLEIKRKLFRIRQHDPAREHERRIFIQQYFDEAIS